MSRALTYANADRLLDMRDEEMALRDEEVTGELPGGSEYEEFNEIREQLAAIIEEQLGRVQNQTSAAGSGLVGTRIFVISVHVTLTLRVLLLIRRYVLAVAQADFTGLPAKWQPINDYGAKVYRRMSSTNIEQVMPVAGRRWRICYRR